MAYERASGLIVRTHDWSETSRIVVVWTRQLGKVRLLAKGGRRLKSNFEVALDLLTVCSIVWLRKPSAGGLEILTEARAEERFPALRRNLKALNAGYYIAELMGEGTQDYDPHPGLYDASLAALRQLGESESATLGIVGWFEWAWLRESGHLPITHACVQCARLRSNLEAPASFTVAGGGIICPACRSAFRDARELDADCLNYLAGLEQYAPETWSNLKPVPRRQARQILSDSVIHHLGKMPRLLSFLN